MPIVLKSINLNICMWHIRTTQPLSIGILFASCMSRMTEYIAIEDDNVISHFLQVLVIGWQTAVNAVIGNSNGWVLVIKHDATKLHLKVSVIIVTYQDLLW